MNAFRLTLAYDGTDFAGWQSQARGGARTVQGVLEEALARLSGGERVAVSGAGRTDAGVHALGQVASFAFPRPFDPLALQRALNALLAADLRVLAAEAVHDSFHARKSATGKTYRYELDTGPVQLPTRRRYAAHVPFRLDPHAVAATAALFRGRQDFAALCSTGGSTRTTIRTVTRSDAEVRGDTLVYETEANGFLRKMVRSMVGALVAAGRGAITPDDLAARLQARDRRSWPAPAEARGLTLVRVTYGDG
ncbi:MAG TPA: tRNA pseudouridine(38-40) synthase TruA [Vicinamibacteria bacterium]|nr:tRNA pseudouridine(38-40) synthase TruA [Vicinamibacteria bacterium]